MMDINQQKEIDERREKLLPESIDFDEKKNTLLLNIPLKVVDVENVRAFAESKGLHQKGDFHITILGFTNGNRLKESLNKMSEEDKKQSLTKIKLLTTETDWSFSLQPQKYYIEKNYPIAEVDCEGIEHRESVIQMVDMPGLGEFYVRLNSLLGVDFDIPPAHITLFTNSDREGNSRRGIGVKSASELTSLNPVAI